MGAPRPTPALEQPSAKTPEKVRFSGGNQVALVGGIEEVILTLENFDFAPNKAPTHDQKFPHLVTHKVYIASGGEGQLTVDPVHDWIIDSGCTAHMCVDRSLIDDYRPCSSQVTAAGAPAPVIGKGTVRFKALIGTEGVITNVTLKDVLHVPSSFELN